jgi:ubiquinone/menaquinone biosynthesis C-methylase UbiE
VDLGSGAEYFSLKLGDIVGKQGQVIAVDLRRLSLAFLRIRALIRNQDNIEIIVGSVDDPRLPAGCADAVLISNTYHEFTDPPRMLAHSFRALRPGGRLVILDRGPSEQDAQPYSASSPGHEIRPALAEDQVRQTGFEIIGRNDSFIDQPTDEPSRLLGAATLASLLS